MLHIITYHFIVTVLLGFSSLAIFRFICTCIAEQLAGRPMRVLKNDYIMHWENERAKEIKELTSKGIIPVMHDIEQRTAEGKTISAKEMAAHRVCRCRRRAYGRTCCCCCCCCCC
jgi:hypothetical protein